MFEAELKVAVELVALLRGPIELLHYLDRGLAARMRRAACTVAINLNEARWRSGQERQQLFIDAFDSVSEAHTALYLAESFGHLGPEVVVPARLLLNQQLAMLGDRLPPTPY